MGSAFTCDYHRSFTPQEIIAKTITAIKEWEAAQQKKPPPSTSLCRPPLICDCPDSTVLCYTDAAWKSDTKNAGLAWIFTDLATQEINRNSATQDSVSSALMAEALAIRGALLHVTSLHYTNIWIRSDSQVLIQVKDNR
ncbi:unnamed protein product [Brassica oleracea]